MPPATASLSPFAAELLPAILAQSGGAPLLTVDQAAAALASLGAVGSTPDGLRKLLRLQQVPRDALVEMTGAIRIAATGLAAWIAGDLKVDKRPRKQRGGEAVPVPSAKRRAVAPPAPMPRLSAASAEGFILPRGARLRFVIREPGDARPTAPGVRALVPRRHPPRPPERTTAEDALLVRFAAELDAALGRASERLHVEASAEDRAALWDEVGGEPTAEPKRRRARPGGL